MIKVLSHQTNINNTPVKYEASGYCSYVVDGDTLDVDGICRIRLVGINAPKLVNLVIKKLKTL